MIHSVGGVEHGKKDGPAAPINGKAMHAKGSNGIARASTWSEAGKASSPLLLSIRFVNGDGYNEEIGGNHRTQRQEKDLVDHMFPPLAFLVESLRQTLPAFPACMAIYQTGISASWFRDKR
jgi:hypothetical protein